MKGNKFVMLGERSNKTGRITKNEHYSIEHFFRKIFISPKLFFDMDLNVGLFNRIFRPKKIDELVTKKVRQMILTLINENHGAMIVKTIDLINADNFGKKKK